MENKVEQQPLFKVIKPGLLTTIQDLGRTGFQKYGVVVSGAMDPFALQTANLLVGNRRDEACLEITMMGPELVVLSEATIAICGADLSPMINGKAAPMWKSIQLKKDDYVTFGAPQSGIRTYLSVSGGFDSPVVMGSKSTYQKAGIGKHVEKEDTIFGYAVNGKAGVGLMHTEIPRYRKEVELRVVKGPHTERFTKEGIDNFFNNVHLVSPQADRMGYRLQSKAIAHKNGADIWSDAIPFGGVQVPVNGQPIILMADRQTTGGYTRIATVISVDLPKVAQLVPGGKIRFREVDVEEAQKLYREREQFLLQIKYFCRGDSSVKGKNGYSKRRVD
ncbi:biotin-dependent carboxyltransferase family protein [Oceanobacillus oncorhynchi subsp. oncorhynchi]|uniref:5-oxoprolinase subunit C family protein n=1 Tax=Oceanobacillus oncorhynchi TaxID=545501 RepID=UPI0031D93FED